MFIEDSEAWLLVARSVFIENRLQFLNISEENCPVLRNGKCVKNEKIIGKFGHKTFNFLSCQLMEIIGIDN